MSSKRASGAVRARVLARLRVLLDERGPGLYSSLRAAGRSLAADLDISLSTALRALRDPQNAALADAIALAVQPCSPLDGADVSRDRNAGFGGEPPVNHPVNHPGSPGSPGSPVNASPQVTPGSPEVNHPGPSRARDPRCSTSSAPLCSPAATDSASSPLASTTLKAFPTHARPSRFGGECLTCGCWLEEGQGLILVPYRGEARLFCIDDADEGLQWAQIEWRLAGHDVPTRRVRKPKSDPNPQPEE